MTYLKYNIDMLRAGGNNNDEAGDICDTLGNHQVPPHTLILKVGDVCMVMRNLDVDNGLTNNLRVRILQIKTYSIRVQSLTDNPTCFWLPRIKFKFRGTYGDAFEIIRKQFPLRLAYSMTYNKVFYNALI